MTGKNLLSKLLGGGVNSGPPASQVTSVLSYLVAGQKLVVKAHSFHTGHKGLAFTTPPPISEYLQKQISTIALKYFVQNPSPSPKLSFFFQFSQL